MKTVCLLLPMCGWQMGEARVVVCRKSAHDDAFCQRFHHCCTFVLTHLSAKINCYRDELRYCAHEAEGLQKNASQAPTQEIKRGQWFISCRGPNKALTFLRALESPSIFNSSQEFVETSGSLELMIQKGRTRPLLTKNNPRWSMVTSDQEIYHWR